VTNAIGYQMQLSTASSFSSFVTNISQLSTARRANNLQSGATYYWRVRAINQAGMSGWSSVATFTVNTTPHPPTGITNGGFETGDFTGWPRTGTTSISTIAHTGTHSAMLGATTPTNGDSTIVQTFTAPSTASFVSFYYQMSCHSNPTLDWATA